MYGRIDGETPMRAKIREGLDLLLREVDTVGVPEHVSELEGVSIWQIRRQSRNSAELTAKILSTEIDKVIPNTGGKGIISVDTEGANVLVNIARIS